MKSIFHIISISINYCSQLAAFNCFSWLKSRSLLSTVLLLILIFNHEGTFGQAASFNYDTQTGILGTTYSWIDCSSGSNIVSGDDAQASIAWPFNFAFYDNTYTTTNSLSVATNGFIRLDGTASTSYTAASAYNLSATSIELGQIIAMAVYDDKVGDNGGWVRSLVTGSSPNRIFTIEYNNLEIDYNDGRYTDVQVSFYETTYKVVLKLGTDNIYKDGVDMGIHSGVNNYFDKWQEVLNGTNNAWIEYTPTSPPDPPSPPAASWNYGFSSGTLGTTYSWIDCSSGSFVVSGDDVQAQISWPFEFKYYDNTYTTSKSLSVCSNGFIRLDGIAATDYTSAEVYDLTSGATNLGQIIAIAVYDGNVSASSWVRSLVTGTAPNRVFTIEYNNYEIDYNDGLYANAQVSFYESTNKIILKLGTDNINKSGVDMGLHSGVSTFFNKWQEVLSGTNNTWIEYTPPDVEINATIGTSLAYYPTLKNAFDKINDGTHQGVITIKINNSTTEPVSAVLNNSGSGSASYSSINMYPTKTGLSISGNLGSPLIDLNGADNVTIDGRVNATGSTADLKIINSSTSTNSTIRLVNKAQNNTIKYCTIEGSETMTNGGVVFLSTTSSSGGNSYNTIEYNNITNSTDANRPVNAICSQGTTGKENSDNIISNNNIYDFLNRSSSSNGICLSDNSSNFTINGNSFYETASFVPTASVTYYIIYINNTSTSGCLISNNYIGGSAPQCGGTAWTKTNVTNNAFYGLYIAAGETSTNSIQNNTIQNFNWSNSGTAQWIGMRISGGNANIGTVTGNTIGAQTGTESVELACAATTGSVDSYGIYITSTGTVNISNNSIGSIKTTSTTSVPYSFRGIFKGGNIAGDLYIIDNLIGSLSTANSIQASTSVTSALGQNVYGIRSDGTGNTEIHGNTVANLFCAYNYATATKGQVAGIYTTNGINKITENEIRNLSSSSPSNDSNSNAAVIGISQQSSIGGQMVSNNTVYNLSSAYTGTRAVSVMGIYYYGGTNGTDTISENFIHSLDLASTSPVATPSTIIGIKIYAGTNFVYNNIVSIGTSLTKGCSVYGILENGNTSHTNKFYFNTVYIGGSISVETASTYAFYNLTNTSTRDFRDNLFYNARSGGTTGSHYAIRIAGTANLTIDYNDYYVSGTGGILGQVVSTDKTDLTSWQSATGQDASSLNTNPNFTSAGGTDADDYVTTASLPGIAITGVTTDYDGITRSDPPKMGALEVSPTFTWQGNTSTDFATAINWVEGSVPPDGANISFATTPANDCYLDHNRTLNNITNTSAKKLVLNAYQLTITGDIVSVTSNQIDASTSSSSVIFAGNAAQSIPNGGFVSNTIDALTLNNEHGLIQNGDLTLPTGFTLTNGDYSIGANTLTINGAISTTSGSLTGGSTSNINIGGSGASTTLPAVSLNNLTLNRANGITMGGALSIGGTLTLTSGTLTLGPDTTTISGNSPIRTTGNIDASNSSSTLLFSNTSAITLVASLFTGSINNLTVNGAGVTAGSDLTINGILNLQSANPSATKGGLDMSTYTLNMESASTTTGVGDVTGVIKRDHTFIGNVQYSFGNQFTTITFINTGTKPGWISCKVSIGLAPSWKSDAVKREYSFAKDAGTDNVIMNLHYLDAELNGDELDESKLVLWDHHNLPTPNYLTEPHGKSNYDPTNNWVGIGGMGIGYVAPTATHDDKLWGFDYSNVTRIIWTGLDNTNEGDWSSSGNWNGGVPTSTDDILIPAGLSTSYPYTNSNPGTVPALAKTIEIEAGASVTVDSYDITISGSTGAWLNNGVFNAGTGKVIFNKGSAPYSYIVNISGTTNFNTIEVADDTYIQPASGSIIRIGGALIAGNNSILDFIATSNTIEYSGGSQDVLNPIGPGTDNGYYNLILSGSGTKTLSGTPMIITGNFNIKGTTTVTVAASVDVWGDLFIDEGTTIEAGAYTYNIGGNITNNGTFTASVGNTIVLNGTSIQSVDGSSTPANFYNLTIDNNAGVVFYKDLNVYLTLSLSNGNLKFGGNTLGINGTISQTSGHIETITTSSLAFGGTTALSLAANLFDTPPTINNLSINRTGGVEFSSNLTVNGILNLQSANPSSTKGTLDIGSDTLNMGENATTTGIGDVTGIIKREHTFTTNTEYTYGSQYTTINFIDENLAPTWICVKVSIGSVPAWTPWSPSPNGKVKRLYQFSCSDNSSTAQTNINTRYLLSELDATYNDEHKLIFWHKSASFAGGAPHEHGKSSQNLTNHVIGLTGLIFGTWASDDLDESQMGMAYSLTAKNTWKGEVAGHETEWEQSQNWTAGNVPLSTDDVLIPGGLAYYPSLTASANAVTKSIEIDPGASITANSYNITVSGSGGAWVNEGTFIPGTGTVTFDHGVLTEFVTVAGITNFYNIHISGNTTLVAVPGCTFRIGGAATGTPGQSRGDWSAVNSTVEWNGVNQNINNPPGTDGSSGYYNLILSGSGTKTMPSSALNVRGDFTISGTATAVASDSIYVFGNTTIESGTTFDQGIYTHLLRGNFENNGTFNPTSGGGITFNGTTVQTISGSSTSSFDNLTIENLQGITLETNINVNNLLTFNNGTLSVGANTLGINGSVSNPSGNIEVAANSSLSFGGTSAIILNNNLFNGNPTINNLTINRSGGVTLGNENITVDGTLTLTSGTLAIAANTLTLVGNAPVRTSGNIDVSHTSATLAFENTAAITLPALLFSGNVNNLTIDGAGGITAGGDFTLDGILNLQSVNPSSVKGSLDMSSYTLTMGATSTTIGQGDVTGIIKRTSIESNTTYSMGNQYTTIYFPNVGTLPTEISLKVSLGSAPSWRTGAIERVYDFIQTGGSETEAVLQSHYLDSELNGNNEAELVQFMHIYAYPLTVEYGRSDYNTNENWVSVSHVNVGVFSSVFGAIEMVVDEHELQDLTWNGSTSTSWVTATNWTPQGAPSDETVVTIPDAATTTFDPFIPETAICEKVIIESGGILNSVDNGQVTVKGARGAWVNNGTFAPGTGTVIFANGNETDTVTISGTNSFYNLTITDKTRFLPDTNSVTNIEGEFIANTSNCIADFSTNPNTVTYNGNKEQSVINPGGIYGYDNLNFTGDGTKILPESSLMILGNLTMDAAVSSTGNTILMAGTAAQNMGGATAATLNDLTIDNASGVTLTNTANTTISGSLLINTGKKFEIAAGQKLTVNGSITNNAGSEGFILNSDATGTASIIHNSDDIAATVERYISGDAEDWHFLSSPVAAQGISGDWLPSGTYGNGTGYDLYLWNEPTSCWIYKLNTTTPVNWSTVHPGADFVAGRGYLYSVEAANPTKSFAGSLNNGDQTIPITYSSSVDSVKGFNLLGNPYPSSIDWMAASGWTYTDLVESGGGYNVWIWNPAANNYGVYNSADADGTGTNSVTRYIAPMQGFFVEAANDGNLGMSNSIRVHDGADNWFKNQQLQPNNVSVLVSSDAGLGSDEIRLEFGYPEKEHGAKKLFSYVTTAPSLYMPSALEDLTVGYFTTPDETVRVPVNFTPGAAGDFTMNCQFDTETFDMVWLEDRKENYYMDLKLIPEYRFSGTPSDHVDRFVLYFGAMSPQENRELPARIYYDGNKMVVDLSLVDQNANVQIVDLLGRVLLTATAEGKLTNTFTILTQKQILIVHVSTNSASISRKIFMNRF
ncbi:MAG: hypothetical protein KQH67_12375 [Bacteroidetes bacterium]|nr:hypothetical protein [Bacteroidota bacterium]